MTTKPLMEKIEEMRGKKIARCKCRKGTTLKDQINGLRIIKSPKMPKTESLCADAHNGALDDVLVEIDEFIKEVKKIRFNNEWWCNCNGYHSALDEILAMLAESVKERDV